MLLQSQITSQNAPFSNTGLLMSFDNLGMGMVSILQSQI